MDAGLINDLRQHLASRQGLHAGVAAVGLVNQPWQGGRNVPAGHERGNVILFDVSIECNGCGKHLKLWLSHQNHVEGIARIEKRAGILGWKISGSGPAHWCPNCVTTGRSETIRPGQKGK
jgi:hypothetical protein